MKPIIILLLMVSVAAACPPGELETWVCDKKDIPVKDCKWVSECSKVSLTAPSVLPVLPAYALCDNGAGVLVKCPPPTKCEGVKVYELKSMRTSVCWQCDKYICEGNGYTGEECYDSCSFSDSRYEQLRRIWGK